MTKGPTSNSPVEAAPAIRAVAAMYIGAAAVLGLGGCISLLPKAPPVQLYEFGQRPPSPAAAAAAPALVAVALTGVVLPRAAVGDQILTITGQKAAFIEDGRWVTPASVMFQADTEQAFEADARRVRLLPRGEFGGATALLRLDVGDFEARYDNGAGAAPTILVSLRATLSRPDGDTLLQQSFTVRQAASEDRIGSIVAAFDAATSQVLKQVTAWTDANAPAAEPPPGSDSTASTTTTTTSSTTSTTHRRRHPD